MLLGTPAAAGVEDALAREAAVAPAHFDAEVLGTLERAVRLRDVTVTVAAEAVRRLAALPVERMPLAPIVAEAFELRDRYGASDSLYAVLAERVGASLLTADQRLSNAAHGHVPVIFVGRQ